MFDPAAAALRKFQRLSGAARPDRDLFRKLRRIEHEVIRVRSRSGAGIPPFADKTPAAAFEHRDAAQRPNGFAHGFAALEDDTVFAYKCSNFYNKASEGCILFNDKDLNIDWQVENPITSEKDMCGEAFATFVSPF